MIDDLDNRPKRPWTFSPAAELGFAMAMIHFSKRLIECIAIHIYSKPTKSLNKLIWQMAYTWLFFGIGVPYYIFHPDYKDPYWVNFEPSERKIIYYILLGFFIFC
jgi:hypothetical protein